MRKQHLDLLALSPRDDIGVGGGDVSSHVACAFGDRARHLAGGHVGRASRLERTVAAILMASAVADGSVGIRA